MSYEYLRLNGKFFLSFRDGRLFISKTGPGRPVTEEVNKQAMLELNDVINKHYSLDAKVLKDEIMIHLYEMRGPFHKKLISNLFFGKEREELYKKYGFITNLMDFIDNIYNKLKQERERL